MTNVFYEFHICYFLIFVQQKQNKLHIQYVCRQIFRGPKGFLPVFPQTCPKRFCVPFVHKFSPAKNLKTYFWCDLQKKVLIVFFFKR